MALFQKTILRQFISQQNKTAIDYAYTQFQAHFHNPKVQAEILALKEEQYQEGFLVALFVNILGYVLPANQAEPYNLITEQRNVGNTRKADGAILKNGQVVGVIELKAAKIFDLSKIVSQAFDYKNHHKGCKYVILSNFTKLRFYIEDATEYEEFNLFELDFERFAALYTILHVQNLLTDLPAELKEKSIAHQEKLTLAFYNDYQGFKQFLFTDLVGLNKKHNDLVLFEKTQRILDRIVFLCFAEDKGLLPANHIKNIIAEWEDGKEEGRQETLYSRFVAHFGFINKGFKSKKYDIFPYNGGLFAPDSVLDSLLITDELLANQCTHISRYDFDSDIDVNVLGHIFEHSLNELDEKKAEIIAEAHAKEQGKTFKKNTKRKLDGIFYTPVYITNYIIEETLGKLCEEKQAELGWEGLTVGKVQAYRDWLLTVTVLDPACGSGAFLNQVLNFFIEEHQKIDELESYLTNVRVHSELRHKILENNIFGVDINAESVAITKLSLWLRTAQGKRKLNDLNQNIKIGNSLIDDATIDALAFDWAKEFPLPAGKGGFTLIVGNPPWGAYLSGKEWLKKRYKDTSFGEINSYKYFIDLAIGLLSNEGVLGFILPDSYLEKDYFSDVRKLVNENCSIIKNIRIGDAIFKDVNLPSSILIAQKNNVIPKKFFFADLSKQSIQAKIDLLGNAKENILFDTKQPTIEKSFIAKSTFFRKNKYIHLIDVYEQVMGVKVYQVGKGKPKQTGYELENNVFISNEKLDNNYYPFISQGIHRYTYESKNEYIKYGEWLAEPRELRYFTTPKIVVREIMNSYIYATLIEQDAVVKNIAGVIIQKDQNYTLEYLLALLCSKLFAYCIKQESPKSANQAFPSITSNTLKNLPIKEITLKEQLFFVDNIKKMLTFYKQLNKIKNDFLDLIESELGKHDFTRKIENWYTLTWNDFSKELDKMKLKLSLRQKKAWKDFFEGEQPNAKNALNEIQILDKKIDEMVYALYDITPEEIKIIENE